MLGLRSLAVALCVVAVAAGCDPNIKNNGGSQYIMYEASDDWLNWRYAVFDLTCKKNVACYVEIEEPKDCLFEMHDEKMVAYCRPRIFYVYDGSGCKARSVNGYSRYKVPPKTTLTSFAAPLNEISTASFLGLFAAVFGSFHLFQ